MIDPEDERHGVLPDDVEEVARRRHDLPLPAGPGDGAPGAELERVERLDGEGEVEDLRHEERAERRCGAGRVGGGPEGRRRGEQEREKEDEVRGDRRRRERRDLRPGREVGPLHDDEPVVEGEPRHLRPLGGADPPLGHARHDAAPRMVEDREPEEDRQDRREREPNEELLQSRVETVLHSGPPRRGTGPRRRG